MRAITAEEARKLGYEVPDEFSPRPDYKPIPVTPPEAPSRAERFGSGVFKTMVAGPKQLGLMAGEAVGLADPGAAERYTTQTDADLALLQANRGPNAGFDTWQMAGEVAPFLAGTAGVGITRGMTSIPSFTSAGEQAAQAAAKAANPTLNWFMGLGKVGAEGAASTVPMYNPQESGGATLRGKATTAGIGGVLSTGMTATVEPAAKLILAKPLSAVLAKGDGLIRKAAATFLNKAQPGDEAAIKAAGVELAPVLDEIGLLWDDLDPLTRTAVTQEISDQAASGAISKGAILRKALLEKWGFKGNSAGTLGQITQDPRLWTRERTIAKDDIGQAIIDRYRNQARRSQEAMGEIRGKIGAVGENAVDAGDAVTRVIDYKTSEINNAVQNLYDKADKVTGDRVVQPNNLKRVLEELEYMGDLGRGKVDTPNDPWPYGTRQLDWVRGYFDAPGLKIGDPVPTSLFDETGKRLTRPATAADVETTPVLTARELMARRKDYASKWSPTDRDTNRKLQMLNEAIDADILAADPQNSYLQAINARKQAGRNDITPLLEKIGNSYLKDGEIASLTGENVVPAIAKLPSKKLQAVKDALTTPHDLISQNDPKASAALVAEGEQAWKEIQAQVFDDMVAKALQADGMVKDTPIIHPDALRKQIENLEKGGRLDIIFGDQADQIREIRKVLSIIKTAPEFNTYNWSHSGHYIEDFYKRLVGKPLAAALPGIGPFLAPAAEKVAEAAEKRGTRKIVNEILSGEAASASALAEYAKQQAKDKMGTFIRSFTPPVAASTGARWRNEQ